METRRRILTRHRKGDGIREISRDLNLARNTVRDVVRNNGGSSVSYTRKNQPYPKLGEYIDTLEKLLRDNKNARPKRNAKHLYEELCLVGYEGSYSSVGRYISKWNERASNISPAACVPLSFAPGEAYQFDWSTDKLLINNEIVTVKVAHFILCYSGRKYIYIYPNEKQEMVFDAHKGFCAYIILYSYRRVGTSAASVREGYKGKNHSKRYYYKYFTARG